MRTNIVLDEKLIRQAMRLAKAQLAVTWWAPVERNS